MNDDDPPTSRNAHLLDECIDLEAALGRFGGDAALFDEMAQIVLEDAPTLVHAARQALAEIQAQEIRRAAHSLKGMMATIGATDAANAAMRVEHAAASGNLAAAGDFILPCGEHVAEVCRALQAYCDSGAAARDRRK